MLRIPDIRIFEKKQTPFYYYDMDLLERTLQAASAQASRYGIEVHYALKANSERRIARKIASAGFGAECVSGNEVQFALGCGFPAERVLFDGVGKTDREIETALLSDIEAFDVESLQELEVLDGIAGRLGKVAAVLLRINPNVDAHTDRRITTGLNENKFGISAHEYEAAVELLRRCGNVRFAGLQFHVGSQIMEVAQVLGEECRKANGMVRFFEEKGLRVDNIDMGGGLGIDYEEPDEAPVPDFETWFRTIARHLERRSGQRVHVEPGRSLVGQCGSLISRVVYVKAGEQKNFLILDAGMNNLMRPALYGAYHKIENLSAFYQRGREEKEAVYDVAGPVCESTDVWGERRALRRSVRGDLIAIRSAGAYGSVLSNNYNMRGFAPAVFSGIGSRPPSVLRKT